MEVLAKAFVGLEEIIPQVWRMSRFPATRVELTKLRDQADQQGAHEIRSLYHSFYYSRIHL